MRPRSAATGAPTSARCRGASCSPCGELRSRNPVFMLDEVDKLTFDFHGDPASALLEVLDPEQNSEFRDNYLEVAFDLSQVFFITTANTAGDHPGSAARPHGDHLPLRLHREREDRHRQGLPDPTPDPRERPADADELSPQDALHKIIREYTREAGVRNLERKIGAICRKAGTRIAEGKGKKYQDYAGAGGGVPRTSDLPTAPRRSTGAPPIPGVVPGLAWTPFGGDMLFIEATKMPGGRGFQVTGSIGNVMQESARAALSYVRSQARRMGSGQEFFDKNDIHMHIPAGATPKRRAFGGCDDGNRAGLTDLRAQSQAAPGDDRRDHFAGQVLPIGGVKEKVLAAHRNGLRTVILPKRNAPDLDDVSDEVRKDMKFILVDSVDDVMKAALEPAKIKAAAKAKTKGSNGKSPDKASKPAIAKPTRPKAGTKAKKNGKSPAG